MRGDYSTEAQWLIDGGMTVDQIRTEIGKKTIALDATWFNNLTTREGARMSALLDRVKVEKGAAAPVADPAPADEPLATDRQVAYVMSLIRGGAHREGGFMVGPTTIDKVRLMTRREASAYISSMKGDY